MSQKEKKSYIKYSLVAGLVFVALYAFAVNRKVVIPVDPMTGGLVLFNGSDVIVSYVLSCYDTAGAVSFTSNLSLSPKTSINAVGSSATNGCAPSTTSNSVFGTDMWKCGSDFYANRANQCGTGFSVCTYSQYNARRGTSYSYGWIDAEASGFQTNWSYYSMSVWSTQSLPAYIPFPQSSNMGTCATLTAGSGTTFDYCGLGYSSWSYPSFCCGTLSALSACSVEIQSGGFLQSPNFKGNAPF